MRHINRTTKHVGILCSVILLLAFTTLAPAANAKTSAQPEAAGSNQELLLSGKTVNIDGDGVPDGHVTVTVGTRHIAPDRIAVSQSNGFYQVRIQLPPGTLPAQPVKLTFKHPSYKSVTRTVGPVAADGKTADGAQRYLTHFSLTLHHRVSPALWIAAAVLLAVYVFIAFDMMHRTLAAMVGAAVLLFVSYTAGTFDSAFRIMTFTQASHAIDDNVIFLLMAMMIIVGVTKKTGVFQWLAYKSFQMARGNIFALSAVLMVVTAVTSAFLDNVTTMLLMIPVTVEIALALDITPLALLMPEVFASNVGGTATLIGDPPNIMIGSYASLSFNQFVEHLAVVCLIGLAMSIAYFLFYFRRSYHSARVADVPAMIARLRSEYRITDKLLLVKSGVVLIITIALFIFHDSLHMQPSIAAMAGASLLLVISGVHIVDMVEQEIEWATLLFFMMLFILVAGAQQTGLIQAIANGVSALSQGSPVLAVILVLWGSAIFSAIIDNIPFTATMLPVVAYLTKSMAGVHGALLWWALSLGACLGGNGTLLGASANVVTAGLAEKAGYPISFRQYLRIALAPMLITVAISMLWLLWVAR